MKKLLLLPGGLVMLALLAVFLLPRQPALHGAGRIEDLASSRSAQAADSLHRKIIPESDLPPEGSRSLFDHLVRENGSLPFPFDQVVAMASAYDAQQRPPKRLLIPDGRSLLKGQASFEKPRLVAAFDAIPPVGATIAPRLRGRLFMGYVEDANEIEVISYNAVAGRFEFQLVENYCPGCVPRIVYANRAVCTTCHTGAAPIFPVRPWQETNVNPEISSRIEAQLHGATYFGAQISRQLDDAQAFDDLTDIANVIPTTQKIWLDGCGLEGNDCRRSLLNLALQYAFNPAALDQAGVARDELLALQKRHWPADGIVLANGDLNNRNPLEQGLYDDSFGAQIKRLFVGADKAMQRTGDKLTDFDNLPPLPAEFDPLTPRTPKKIIGAADLDGVYGLAQMFSSADIAWLEELTSYDVSNLTAAIDALPDTQFDAAAFQRVVFLNALAQALGASPRDYCCNDVSEMSPPISQAEPPLALAADSVLQPFEHYCFACHRGNPSARLNFMSGADEVSVLTKIQATSEIRDVLDYERYMGTRKQSSLMPPEDSWQRQALVKAQSEGQQPLAAMREQIPSLFDF